MSSGLENTFVWDVYIGLDIYFNNLHMYSKMSFIHPFGNIYFYFMILLRDMSCCDVDYRFSFYVYSLFLWSKKTTWRHHGFFFSRNFLATMLLLLRSSCVIVQFGPKFSETAIIFLILMPFFFFFFKKRQVQPLLNAHRLIIKIYKKTEMRSAVGV